MENMMYSLRSIFLSGLLSVLFISTGIFRESGTQYGVICPYVFYLFNKKRDALLRLSLC